DYVHRVLKEKHDIDINAVDIKDPVTLGVGLLLNKMFCTGKDIELAVRMCETAGWEVKNYDLESLTCKDKKNQEKKIGGKEVTKITATVLRDMLLFQKNKESYGSLVKTIQDEAAKHSSDELKIKFENPLFVTVSEIEEIAGGFERINEIIGAVRILNVKDEERLDLLPKNLTPE
ncbi:hypothetical protein MEO41_27945, partial [Dolichospermum sp. ST_sed4]|nr:hypothetical protein [Dolichospermum sp. ST_sed4]